MKNTLLHLITENKMTLILPAVFLIFGILVGWKADFGKNSADDTHGETAPRIEADGHEGHGHHEPSVDEDAPKTFGDLEKIKCEHKVGIVDCDNCRFEVGVVKIDPSIESLIETGLVEQIDRVKIITLTGQIQLDRTKTVEVVAAGGGRVKQVKKLIGEKAAQGDILAVIHSADLGQAKADFLEVQAKLDLAEATYRREKGLYEKKITSQADYQNALNELNAAQASYAAAEKRLWLFGLGTDQIAGIKDEKENGGFADLALSAPQSGTIIAQNISVGKIVDTTEALYTIADLSNLWVWCDVYEKDLAMLHEQFSKEKLLSAKVRVKAFESTAFNGAVDFVGNLMDEHTRTVKMRVQVKNPEGKLKPGMFADVEVAIPLPGRIAAVPDMAVMSDAGKYFVFQHWKNDLWVRRDVAIGERYGNVVELLNGVPQGAKIVTGGTFMLKSDILREKMGAGCAD